MVPTLLTSTVDVLKALGHPARLRIVTMLRGGPLSVCQISAVLGVAASTVSGHLLDLRRAGLVTEQRRGKWVFYWLEAEPPVKTAVRALVAALSEDPQVEEDQSLAAVLRAQAAATSCGGGLPGSNRSTVTGGAGRAGTDTALARRPRSSYISEVVEMKR